MPTLLRLTDASATRSGQLTLSNVVNDAYRAVGTQGDPTAPTGTTWIGPAVTNIATDPVGATGATGVSVGNLITETNIAYSSQAGESTGYSGITTAVKAVADGSAGTIIYSWVVATTPAIGATYTAKLKIRASAGGVGRTVALRWRAVGGGTGNAYVGTSSSIVLTSAYQTITVSGTVDTADRATLYARIEDQTSAPANGDTFYATVIMLETGGVANPFTATSRGAGRAQMPWTPDLFTATQGWVAIRWRSGYAGASIPFVARQFSWGSAADNMIRLSQGGTAYNLFNDATGGGAAQQPGQNYTPVAGTAATAIGAWTATDLGVSADGAALTLAGSRSEIPVITASTFDIGGDAITAGRQLVGDVLWFACGSGRLTDSDAARIHAFGNTKPTIRALDSVARGAHAMAVWDGRTGTFQRRIGA